MVETGAVVPRFDADDLHAQVLQISQAADETQAGVRKRGSV